MPIDVKNWLQAVRPLAQLNLAVPIVFGEAFAYYATGSVNWVGVLWAHAFSLSAQPAIIFANDLADEHVDGLREKSTLLSGGSRVLVEQKLSREALHTALKAACIAHLAVGGLASMWLEHALPLVCACATLVLTQLYSFAPVRLAYRGGGSLVQGLGTGVVLPVVATALASKSLLTPPWMILVATFFLGVISNWVTSIPDADRDHEGNKKSLAGRFGDRRAALLSWAAIFVVSLSGFRSHGRLQSEAMPIVTLVCWLGLALAAIVIWKRPTKPVLATWLLLSAIQLLWLGWSAVLVTQAH